MRFLIVVHRWLGVALCLIVFVWFLSGIGMMYWDFPDVSPSDRLSRSPALDETKVIVPPADALTRAGMAAAPTDIRLNTFDGRPVYRFRAGRRETIVYADTGTIQEGVSIHGLHSLNFPWRYNYRPAWDIVMIAFMIGGASLSATSVLLAWRVVGRRFQRSVEG